MNKRWWWVVSRGHSTPTKVFLSTLRIVSDIPCTPCSNRYQTYIIRLRYLCLPQIVSRSHPLINIFTFSLVSKFWTNISNNQMLCEIIILIFYYYLGIFPCNGICYYSFISGIFTFWGSWRLPYVAVLHFPLPKPQSQTGPILLSKNNNNNLKMV